jgi:hypothetical protein
VDVVNDHEVVPVARVNAPPSMLTVTFCKLVSAALPVIVGVTVVRLAFDTGAVIETVGAVVSIVIVIDVVAVLPALSVTRAFIVCETCVRVAVVNDHEVVPVARVNAPESTWTSTFWTPEPLASDDVPEIVGVLEAINAPLLGVVIDIVGASES